MLRLISVSFLTMLLCPYPVVLAAESLPGPDGRPASSLWTEQLMNESQMLIEQRRQAFENIRTPEDAQAWQAARRQFFIDRTGGIPEPAVPAAQVVGTIDGGDFTVEKVIYESRPNHHITAVLYLPKSVKPPYAAMLICCGHSYNGKAADGYQRVGILAAKHGLAALCFDPVGQGERYQIVNVEGRPGHHTQERPNPRLVEIQQLTPSAPPQYNPVEEHTLMGIGPILLGSNTAHYRIWDAMRSVDYLISRPDIDPARIGVTGNSGGGTESSYLMALDPRIAAAAPGCFLTSYERLLQKNGPQDAEQNIFGQLQFGLDEADYVTLTAPRPVCILAATHDATFDIRGTWDVFRESKRFYGKLGFPERVDLVEADDVHGFTVHLREGAVRWMRRWLRHIDEAVFETDFPVFSTSDLQCTPQGQVLLLKNERSVFDLSRETSDRLAARRMRAGKPQSDDQLRTRIAETIGVDRTGFPRVQSKQPVHPDGQQPKNCDWLLREDRLPLLIRMEKPDGASGELMLYVSERGARSLARDREPLQSWLQNGMTVASLDVTGMGATAPQPERHWSGELFGPNVRQFFLAYLNGRSVVGIRTEDVLAAAEHLSQQSGGRPVHVQGSGAAAIAVLHAAALDPQRFASVTLENCATSWQTVVATPVPENQLVNTVHGALQVYDLPDLAELAGGSRRVRWK